MILSCNVYSRLRPFSSSIFIYSYPYNFGSLASITSSSAGGLYYYFFYDVQIRKSPNIYSICDGASIVVGGNVYNTSGFYIDSLISSFGCDSIVYSSVVEPQLPLNISPQLFAVPCKGDSTGMLVGDAQGSWAPYKYYWLSSKYLCF